MFPFIGWSGQEEGDEQGDTVAVDDGVTAVPGWDMTATPFGKASSVPDLLNKFKLNKFKLFS
jgi:hypothetical protein